MTNLEKLEKLIYEGFKEMKEGFQETDRRFKETDHRFQEMRKDFQETDRKFQETHRDFQEIKESFRETDRKFQETDRKFQETDRRFKETDRQFRESKKMVDALTGKWGRFVEGLVIPAMKRMFRERGIEVGQVSTRSESSQNGHHMEFDIVGLSDEYVILVEVKSTLSVSDVNDHLARLKNFRTFFPQYAPYKALGAVAGIVIESDADVHAYRKGLFVIAQSGDSVKILNDDKFTPTVW